MTQHYDVYAIGNALVDLEYRVNDDFLTEMGITKGLMTLAEEAHQQKLLAELDKRFPRVKQASGGSAANSIIAVSYFGGRSFYSCKVANDTIGEFYVSDLHAAGVHSNLHQERENGTSGTCVVMVTPDAERTMNTFLGITADVSEAEVMEDALRASRWLYIEGYLCTSPSARAGVSHARSIARTAGIPVAMTFSDPSMVKFFKPQLAEMLAEGVDLLFCNEEEALEWSSRENLQEAVAVLREKAERCVITRGKQGALVVDQAGTLEVPPHLVEAVDTNGAGDMFAGAFLYGITNGLSSQNAARLASRASAEVVRHFGPRLPAEAHQRIKQEILG